MSTTGHDDAEFTPWTTEDLSVEILRSADAVALGEDDVLSAREYLAGLAGRPLTDEERRMLADGIRDSQARRRWSVL